MILISQIFNYVPKSKDSHVFGHSYIWGSRFKYDNVAYRQNRLIYDAEEIFIDHGVNFSGSLNIFGGLSEDTYNCVNYLIESAKNATIYSIGLDIESVDYIGQMKKRLNAKSTYHLFNDDFFERFNKYINCAQTFKMQDFMLKNCIVGDSHSLAFSASDDAVFFENGRTLYSVLNKQSVTDYIIERTNDIRHEQVTICLGSIDIRHHINRNNTCVKDLCQEYYKQIIAAEISLDCKIKVCAPVPVEHEGRRLPKTGQFLNANFAGTRKKRLEYSLLFIDEMNRLLGPENVIMPPIYWYMQNGEEYAKEIMESKGSVHISPRNYRSANN